MPIRNIDREVDRVLTLLRNRIRQQGFTQLEVQQELGWGRSYISQLMTRQKSIRVEQVLMILNVIDVEPAEFWGELYPSSSEGRGRGRGQLSKRQAARPPRAGAPAPFPEGDDLENGLRRIRLMYNGVVHVLTNKGLITSDALEAAVTRVREQEAGGPRR